MPLWRADGKEIYFLNPDGAIMAAPISATSVSIEPIAPVVPFPTRIAGGGVDVQQHRQVRRPPRRAFPINTELEGGVAPIRLIQNWNPETKK